MPILLAVCAGDLRPARLSTACRGRLGLAWACLHCGPLVWSAQATTKPSRPTWFYTASMVTGRSSYWRNSPAELRQTVHGKGARNQKATAEMHGRGSRSSDPMTACSRRWWQ